MNSEKRAKTSEEPMITHANPSHGDQGSSEPVVSTDLAPAANGNGRRPPPSVPPTRRSRQQGGDGEAAGTNGGLSQWFIDANPLYLISVLLMFLGLLLVSGEANTKQVGVETVALFFGIQNIYEMLMVAMGIYLLRSSTNLRHGKILLLFVLIFMADLTFYQVRISALSAGWGQMVSLLYLLSGAVKLGLAVHLLRITPYWDRLLFPMGAFALIYFAPQYVYHSMDAVGRAGASAAGVPFSGVTEIYMIWVLAALIQLPFIVATWRRSNLEDSTPHALLGTEQSFYWALLLVPFVALPFQLVKNMMADAMAANRAIADMTFVYVPYLLAGLFFVQAFIQKTIRQQGCQNGFDFVMLMGVVGFAWVTWQPGEIMAPLGKANLLLALAGHIAVVITRQNLYSAGFLTMIVTWQFFGWIKAGMLRAAGFLSELSSLAWAGILMTGSFIFLGLGFLLSLKSGRQGALATGAGSPVQPS